MKETRCEKFSLASLKFLLGYVEFVQVCYAIILLFPSQQNIDNAVSFVIYTVFIIFIKQDIMMRGEKKLLDTINETMQLIKELQGKKE